MDWVEGGKKTVGLLKKYSYVLLILGIGIVLMLLPSGGAATESSQVHSETTPAQPSTQEALEEILSQIQGAGRVRVLLTIARGESIQYQTDEDSVTGTDSTSVKIKTVIVNDAGKAQQGLVQQIDPPEYLGAVVVCQGADSAAVRLAIMEAVADATGLTMDRISVLKMK